MFPFPHKMRVQDATSRVSESGRSEMTILSSDYARIMVESNFFWRKQLRVWRLSTAILTRKIAWQAQYLVKLGADSRCK